MMTHICNIQCLDILLLAEDLGKAIEGTWEFHHNQHCLKVVRYLEPRRVALGEVRGHFVDGSEGIFIIADLDVHGHFELKIGGDDTRLPIVFLKVGPK